jgi:hypothetical protein
MTNHEKIERFKLHAVDKYLEQVKILTTLASALLLSPGFVLALLRIREDIGFSDKLLLQATIAVAGSSVAFVLTIFFTYFIYSSIAGDLNEGECNIYREETQRFSIMQFVAVLIGCSFYIWFIIILLRA